MKLAHHHVCLFLLVLVIALAGSPQDSRAQNHITLVPPTADTPPQNKAAPEQQPETQARQARSVPPAAEDTIRRQLYFLSDSGLTNGSYLLQHQKYAAALQVFQEVLERNSRNVDAVAGLGAAYLGLGQTKAAGDEIRKALARDNRHIGANYLLGRYYLEIDRPEQAIEQLRVLTMLCGRNGCPENLTLQAEIDESRKNKPAQ